MSNTRIGARSSNASPLYGRAVEAFAVQPLRPGYLGDAFPTVPPPGLLTLHALWGGMPRNWELAERFGDDVEAAVDALVLDPGGPLHDEPDRLLRKEMPPATALRPLLDVIGAGAHRASEIGGRLNRPVSSLSRPLAALSAMKLVRRETPFGSDPKSGKRSLYRIDDPFLRLWFRVVAAHRAMLAEAPAETRLALWNRHRPGLEAAAWEEVCRMAVPLLHRSDNALAKLGPWLPAQRYWRGNDPEFDLVSRSVDGRRLLVGEAKRSAPGSHDRTYPRPGVEALPGTEDREIVYALFLPDARAVEGAEPPVRVVDAKSVFSVLRAENEFAGET